MIYNYSRDKSRLVPRISLYTVLLTNFTVLSFVFRDTFTTGVNAIDQYAGTKILANVVIAWVGCNKMQSKVNYTIMCVTVELTIIPYKIKGEF